MRDWTAIVRTRLRQHTGAPPDPDVVEEVAAHLAQTNDDAARSGMTDDEAADRALRILDAPDLFLAAIDAKRPRGAARLADWTRREAPPPPEGARLMRSLDIRRDSRYALRMLTRAPVFSAVAILTFAIGIGVNTAVFSVVNGVLLRPLPYPDADRITMVWMDNERQGIREDITSYPNYADWRDQNSSYAQLAAMARTSFSLTGAGEPERLLGARVTASFFDVMGLPPILGRVFTAEHEVEGRDAVAVISQGLWVRRFGGAQDVLGRTLLLNGRPFEVIGVMPGALKLPDDAELWTPLAPTEGQRRARFSFWLPVIGRLQPDVTVEQAQTEMSGITARIVEEFPNMRGFGAYIEPLEHEIVGDVQQGLLVLMGAVAFVLLIACVNLANLMLGRTTARRRELAIRTALGAGRGRIVRQIVTEATVLALLGGALGVAFAYWATGFFIRLAGDGIPRADSIGVDARVLAFALGMAVLAALLSSLVPALQASSAAVADRLREGGRQGGGAAAHRTRSTLVAAEVALALVLLTGAGLLTRTLWNMQGLDRGFEADGVVTATVSPPASSYTGAAEIRGFYTRLLERVRAVPGVESAALTTGVLQPLLANSTIFTIEGQPPPPPEERIEYPFESISPEFFETLRIRLAAGRDVSDQDHADAPFAAVVNETLARQAWPGQDPIGRRLRPGGANSDAPWITVVGVIRDVHRVAPRRAIRPEVYLSALQATPRTLSILVRTDRDPASMLQAIRREVQALDPQIPLYRTGTLSAELSATLNQPRFQATLLAVFAAIALGLAMVGIYGVTSHAVSGRTQEVGIRIALGARGGDVLRLILMQHLKPAIAGVAIGLGAALALGQFMQNLLYGVRAVDPWTYVLMSLALLMVAVPACLIPARRAMRIDPLDALRME